MFLAYADPGDGGEPNPRLVDMGYVRDDPGVTASPTPIRPFALPSTGDPATPIVLEADVAIVGSGAGGGVVAKALAEAGRSVVVLEAGALSTEPDMPRAEIDAFDRLYLDHGLTSTADGSISILAGSGIGGGTTINWMTSIAAPDPVRAGWARAHGIAGFDAAEGDADLRGDRGRAVGHRDRADPAEGRAPRPGGDGARARGRPDPAQRHRLRRLRLVPVRLPGGLEAVGAPDASRRCVGGRCQDRARGTGRARPARGRQRRRRRGDPGLGATLGSGPGRGRHRHRTSDAHRPCPPGRRGGWCAPDPGRPRAFGDRPPGARAVPASPSRGGGRRLLPRARRDVARAVAGQPVAEPRSTGSVVGTATRSNLRPATRGSSRSPCPGRAPRARPT